MLPMATREHSPRWSWESILERLGEYVDIDESARVHGAIKRARIVRTGEQLLRLVLAYVVSGLSLRSTAAWAEMSGTASLSDVALLKRLRGCGPWLADMVSVLNTKLCPETGDKWRNYRVVAVDATMVCSPGKSNKKYRTLHTVYDVVAHRFVATEVTDGHVSERLDIGAVRSDEIRLGDRGYARHTALSAVVDAGGHYVVRFGARSFSLTDMDGNKLELWKVCRQAETTGTVDMDVQIKKGRSRKYLPARIVIKPLPPEQAEVAGKKMRKNMRKWKSNLTEQALITAGCLMLVTSLPRETWDPDDILELYRQRWQVELAFKRLKSLLDLERLRAFDADLTFAWINAVLLVALLIELERPEVPKTAEPDSPPRAAAA